METLQQRVDQYLREHNRSLGIQVAETTMDEYYLQRAENELRAAQERLDRIRRELESRQR